MANYCTKCGNRVEPDAKFCTSCGARLEAEPAPGAAPPAGGGFPEQYNIRTEDLVDYRETWMTVGKTDADWDEHSKRFNGFLFLTRDELIFAFTPEERERLIKYRKGKDVEKYIEPRRVPLSSIDKAKENWGNIWYTIKAPEGAGVLKKLASYAAAGGFKISDAKSFVAKLKELNPNIK